MNVKRDPRGHRLHDQMTGEPISGLDNDRPAAIARDRLDHRCKARPGVDRVARASWPHSRWTGCDRFVSTGAGEKHPDDQRRLDRNGRGGEHLGRSDI
jgi:hypothetical protein